MIDFGKDILIWPNKLPIQILATQTGPIIANNHPIRINHGHNLKNHTLPQLLSPLRIRAHKLNKSLHHVRPITLAGMDSAREEDQLFLHWFIEVCLVDVGGYG